MNCAAARRPARVRSARMARARLLISRALFATLLIATALSLFLVKTKANQAQQQPFPQLPHANEPNLERRSLALAPSGPGAYGAAYAPAGGRTQVAISLARVPNPDDEEESGAYGKGYPGKRRKKKKFPITWLRNQYPFSSYQKRKKHYEKLPALPPTGDLSGQYSSPAFDVMDPNPSTWVRLPNRPTASIKFHKQSQGPMGPADIEPASPYAMGPPLPPPMSLMPQPGPPGDHLLLRPPFAEGPRGPLLPGRPGPVKMAGGGLMTSESQESYSPQKAAAPSAAAASASGGQSEGFGGISLSFGNGRSISFGGGKGLTIGGKAGAIEIGRNAGGISIGGADNQPAASGYSETKGGAYANGQSASSSSSSGYGGGSGSGNGYGSDYVNKHPTMSVDVPRRGKKIVHANLDMAPIKFRLHSSPRVKITTGSRDPLEKPSDEELTEEEEDIFEPPAPFPKKNSTENATDSSAATNGANGTANATSSTNGTEPMQLTQLQQNGFDYHQQQQQQQQQYGQQHFSQQQFSQQHFSDYNQRQQFSQEQHFEPAAPHSKGPQHPHYDDFVQGPHFSPGNGNGGGGGGGGGSGYNAHNANRPYTNPRPPHPGHQAHEPARFSQQQLQPPREFYGGQVRPMPQYRVFGPNHAAPGQQGGPPMEPSRQPEPVMTTMQPAQVPTTTMPPPTTINSELNEQRPAQIKGNEQPANMGEMGDQRPAVNQWRQFSREARPHMIGQHQQQPFKQPQDPRLFDQNRVFYNGGHPNSIAGAPARGPPVAEMREGSESSDLAASASQMGAYARSPLPSGQRFSQPVAPLVAHNQFNPTTLYQVVPAQPQPVKGSSQPVQQQQQQQQQAPWQGTKQQAPPQAATGQQAPVQPATTKLQQEGSYHAPTKASYKSQQSSYQNEEAGYKTYTIGGGSGISTSYSSGASGRGYSSGSGYGSGHGSGHGGGGGGGIVSSDGFDRKHYDAKVEKFDPEAHDKRERSKVVLFLRPRISFHMANSSTTTKRPKNRQRLVHVINRPIFLNNITNSNNTNNSMAHHDEEFIDPDLAEPMDVYQYGQGYGHGYTNGYRIKPTSSTTKKPKRRTTTTTTTTTSAPTTSSETESTTSSTATSESEGTTTPASSTTASGENSSSTTSNGDSSSTTTEPTSSTTTSTTTSSSSSSTEGEGSSSSTTAASNGDSSSEVETSSAGPASSSSTTTETPEEASSSSSSSTTAESSSTESDSTPSSDEGASDELTAAATEDSQSVAASSSPAPPPPPPSTTTASSTTTSTSTTTARPPAKSRMTQRSKATTTTTTTSTTTTTTTSTTTPEPPTTTTTEQPPSSSTTEEPTTTTTTETPTTSTSTARPEVEESSTSSSESESSSPAESSSESSSTSAPSSGTSDEAAGATEAPAEDTASLENGAELGTKRSSRSSSRQRPLAQKLEPQAQSHQPMLLNEELIEKLMRNRTLVSLMSSQLKRVVPSEQLDEEEKQRIVRQVFVQMMEKKVDFSMNNVRLAVKTVSSSYRAAAEKSQKLKQLGAANKSAGGGKSAPGASENGDSPKTAASSQKWQSSQRRRNAEPKGPFGRRASTLLASPEEPSAAEQLAAAAGKPAKKAAASKRRDSTAARAAALTSASADESRQVDANGNPIVVVLLPSEKAK